MPRRIRLTPEEQLEQPASLIETIRQAMFTEPHAPDRVQNEGMPGTTETAVRGCSCPACTDMRAEAEEPVTAPLAELADELPEAYAPARGQQLRNISNGEYRFETGERNPVTDQSDFITVRLWTVRSGNLQGQRILRRADPSSSSGWSGFGTLQEDGTVWIWRSAAEELRGSRQHRVLNTQFRTMHHQGTRLRRGVRQTLNGLLVWITNQNCNLCNAVLNSPVAFCPTCLVNQDESVRLDEQQYTPQRTIQADRREASPTPRSGRSSREAARDRDLFAARDRVRPARTPRQPLMSEIDPTRIR